MTTGFVPTSYDEIKALPLDTDFAVDFAPLESCKIYSINIEYPNEVCIS